MAVFVVAFAKNSGEFKGPSHPLFACFRRHCPFVGLVGEQFFNRQPHLSLIAGQETDPEATQDTLAIRRSVIPMVSP